MAPGGTHTWGVQTAGCPPPGVTCTLGRPNLALRGSADGDTPTWGCLCRGVPTSWGARSWGARGCPTNRSTGWDGSTRQKPTWGWGLSVPLRGLSPLLLHRRAVLPFVALPEQRVHRVPGRRPLSACSSPAADGSPLRAGNGGGGAGPREGGGDGAAAASALPGSGAGTGSGREEPGGGSCVLLCSCAAWGGRKRGEGRGIAAHLVQ